MRPTGVTRAQSRDIVFLCSLLIAAHLLLLARVLLPWAHGVPPIHPGYYESRLLSTVSSVALMSALLLSATHHYATPRGRVAYWLLFGIAVVAFAAEVIVY